MRWFTEADLRELAGEQSFARGERSVERVTNVARVRGGVVASVRGSEPAPYSVRLSYETGTLSGTCDCPFGGTGAFCKHCVAAGLVVLGQMSGADPARDDERVQGYLGGLDQAALAELLWEQAGKDDALYHRLSLRAARAGGRPPDLERLGRELDGTLRARGFIGYHGSFEYAARAAAVLAELDGLVSRDRAADAAPLLRQAVEQMTAAIQDMDDSSGAVGDVLTDAVSLHVEACRQAPATPGELASWLFGMQADGPGWPHLRVGRYAAALGDEGLAAYRKLVHDAWERPPAAPPADAPAAAGDSRGVVAGMMEELAELDGDVDALVQVLAADLGSAWRYLRIATVLRDAGRHDESLDWARRGVEATWRQLDPRLIDFTAEALDRAGLHGDLLDLRREAFRHDPSLESYVALRAAAEPAGRWPEERAAALDLLRMAERFQRGQMYRSPVDDLPITHGRNGALVDVLLWEGEDEAAWSAAHAGGCMPTTWRALVQRRAATHPDETIPMYQRFIAEAIDRRDLDGYRRAADLIEQLRDQFDRAGTPAAFRAYVDRIKADHGRKRNLLAELHRRGL